MTEAEEKELAEAVLATRFCGFGPAMSVIKPVVQKFVALREEREHAANVMMRDYGRLLVHQSGLGLDQD